MENSEKNRILAVLALIAALAAGAKFILWPLMAEIHFKKSLKAIDAIEYNKAETELKMAINFRKEPLYFEKLASLYRTMGESSKDRQAARRYYEKSVYFYKQLIQKTPYSSMAYNGLGATCLYIGRDFKDEAFYHSAILNFQKAVELEPKFIEAHLNLASAYYLWGLKDKAVEAYKKALDENENSTMVMFNLGMIYFMEKNYEEAEKYWKRMLEINPASLDAQKGLNLIKSRRKKAVIKGKEKK